MLGRIVDTYKTSRYYRTRLAQIPVANCDVQKSPSADGCEIVCVTYNNADLVAYQDALLKKNFRGAYNFVVADNSSDSACRDKIRAYCQSAGLCYISLPRNPYSTGSQSHAAAVNWLLRNYIAVKKPAYFGFIDHDVFLAHPFSLQEILQSQPVYGLYQERNTIWYLWAGLCFFRFAAVQAEEMDFMPGSVEGTGVDTGGKNWQAVYAQLDKKKLVFPAHSYEKLREGDVAQSDKVELIGPWIHSFNGSYWMKVAPKEAVLENYLKKFL